MTCEEIIKTFGLLADGSIEHTRALRASVIRHAIDCQRCFKKITILADKIKQLFPPEIAAGVDERIQQQALEDMLDPEFKEVVYGNLP